MTDFQDKTRPLFRALGTTVTLAGVELTALVDLEPGPAPGWWDNDAVPAPGMTVRFDDLDDNGLWPLSEGAAVEVGEAAFRVIGFPRAQPADGLVEITLQEAD